MDTFRAVRLVFYFVVGVMLGGVSAFSYAETIPATTQTGYYYYTASGSVFLVGATGQDACTATGIWGSITSLTFFSPSSCNDQNGLKQANVTASSALACPSNQNWTFSGTTCNRPDCVAPQTRQLDGTCSTSCVAGDSSRVARWTGSFSAGDAGKSYLGTSVPLPMTLCNGSCVVGSLYPYSCTSAQDLRGSPIKCSYDGILTGESCHVTDGDSASSPVAPPCMDQGKIQGTLNGVPVCSGTLPNSVQTTKTTTTPTSSTTTTTTTTCVGDGACSSTTTSSTTSGGSGPNGTGPGSTTAPGESTGSKDDTKTGFCAENPNSPLCKASDSSFSGTCGSVPACSGDAVQCAQAQAAFKLDCDAIADDDAQKLARNVVSGSDPVASSLPNPSMPAEVSIGTLDNSEIFASGCPPSPTITAFGHIYTFSLQPLCDLGDPLGKLNVMIALLAALWFVAGSVRGV